ncbi:transposase, partial [Sinosporangium siamense]|uniref:transposase n=1 Tax=Sinosporangium siamense TaxID=1367973 RepID=UPI0035E486E3
MLPRLAISLRGVLEQRRRVAAEVEETLEAHPLARVTITMPGVGVRTCARLLREIGDVSAFATPGHLASYTGIPPVTRRSRSSIKGEHRPKAATRHSSGRCSCRRSPPCPIRRTASTTT